MEKWNVKKEENLRDFLSFTLSLSKGKAKELIDSKSVFVNDRRVWIATHQLKKGDVVELHGGLIQEKKRTEVKKPQFTVLYEDDHIIAVNKPPLILSENAKGSLEEMIRMWKRDGQIRAIHRLDRDTSGVILFAKNEEAFQKYKKMWSEKEVEKKYLAIVHNEADFDKKKVEKEIEGRMATSGVRLLRKKKGFSVFEVMIETGRKHQIRIHLASIRHPVVGDKDYGPKVIQEPLLKSVRRQMLHAFQISFVCPFTGENKKIIALPPEDFAKLAKVAGLDTYSLSKD